MIAKRIQLRRTKGYRKPEGAVVVARPSKWGNPYRLSDYVFEGFDHGGEYPPLRVMQAMHAVRDFEHWLGTCPDGEALAAAARRELRRKDLACWCRLCRKHRAGKPLGLHCDDCAPCHADPLGVAAASEAA